MTLGNAILGPRMGEVRPGLLSTPAPTGASCEPLCAARFFAEHHRPPILGVDPSKPWHYRGWLRTAILSEACRMPRDLLISRFPVLDRWLYHLETVEAGGFLDRPIPGLDFEHPSHLERTETVQMKTKTKTVVKHSSAEREIQTIEDWSRIIGWDMGGWSDFRVLLDWLSWGFGPVKEEPKLDKEKNKKLFRTVDLKPLDRSSLGLPGRLYRRT